MEVLFTSAFELVIWLLGKCIILLSNEVVDCALPILVVFRTFEVVWCFFGKCTTLLSNGELDEAVFE